MSEHKTIEERVEFQSLSIMSAVRQDGVSIRESMEIKIRERGKGHVNLSGMNLNLRTQQGNLGLTYLRLERIAYVVVRVICGSQGVRSAQLRMRVQRKPPSSGRAASAKSALNALP